MKPWLLVVLAACGGPQQVVDTSSAVKIEWHAAQGEGQHVDVTLVVNGQELALGSLEATSDCTLRRAEATATELSCGSTSSYNSFVAELKSGQVIVSLVSGLVGDPNSEERKIVKRVDVTGTMFNVAPYANGH